MSCVGLCALALARPCPACPVCPAWTLFLPSISAPGAVRQELGLTLATCSLEQLRTAPTVPGSTQPSVPSRAQPLEENLMIELTSADKCTATAAMPGPQTAVSISHVPLHTLPRGGRLRDLAAGLAAFQFFFSFSGHITSSTNTA